jgi:GntR family transcriptional repressor for pyruvate dehydrogenase complex
MLARTVSVDDRSEIELQRLRRVPLYEGVAESLREFIAAEKLMPGDRLPAERVLAERLGVSRTSIRQGLTALRVMGLVDVQHGAGAYLVSPVDAVIPPIAADLVIAHPDLPQVRELSIALESEAARLASERGSATDLARISAAIERMAQDIAAGGRGVEDDRDFHRAVVLASGNQVFARVLESVSAGTATIAAASLAREGQPALSLTAHRLVLDALERRDGVDAARLMRQHVAISGDLQLADAG